MEAGRELDALVAKQVMDLNVQHGMVVTVRRSGGPTIDASPPKPYSTDIAAAWEVAEKMREMNRAVEIIFDHGWQANFDSGEYTFGDTAPHAICLAALKARADD